MSNFEISLQNDEVYFSYLISLKNMVAIIAAEDAKVCEACEYFEDTEEDNMDLECICREKNRTIEMYSAAMMELLSLIKTKEEEYEAKNES